MSELRIPVVKGKAGTYPVVCGFGRLSELDSVSFVDAFIMETGNGVQRPLNKQHATSFRRYIEKALTGGSATAPPLILSLREKLNVQNGQLVLPVKKTAVARLDAQHRMAFTGDLDVTLPFVLYYDLTLEQEIEIFTTINDNQKGLQKSLVDSHRLALSKNPKDELPHIAIADQLNKDGDSPWYQAIFTGGVSQNGTPGNKRKITLRTFQDANRELISGPRCQNVEYDQKYEAVRNYWQGVANTFSDAWTENRKHLLTKGVGIAALAQLGRDIIQECFANDDISVAAMTRFLKKLEGFDWGNRTSLLKLVGGSKGASAVAKGFEAIVFGDKDIADMGELLIEA